MLLQRNDYHNGTTTTRYATTQREAMVMDIHYRTRVFSSLVRPDGSAHQRVLDLWTGSIRDRDVVVSYWNQLAGLSAESGYKYDYRVLSAGC
jgi:hypothetical protein